MPRSTTIVLIGPRAAGKTTVGCLLAARLGCPFVDLDDRVRARFGGATVPEIWQSHGEPAFRAAEAAALEELLKPSPDKSLGQPPIVSPRLVLSLGGGTPMIEAARRTLVEAQACGDARVVLLVAPSETLATRLAASRDPRPSLTGDAPEREVERVIAARMPTYSRLAEASFDTASGEAVEVAERIAEWVGGSR